MTAGQLKASILQMAIQGKLVEQRPDEGTGEELYKEIQAEKKRLIKVGRIKKGKELASIDDEDIPFDIPETWKWVRLGDISSYAQSKQKVSPKDITPEMWSLDLEDIEKGTGKVLNHVLAKERKIQGDKVRFKKGNILYGKLRPYLLKILIAEDDGITTPELVPFNIYGINESAFFLWYLRSPYVDNAVNSVSYGVKMPRVGTETMVNLLVPLPSLAEQKRIVSKIEELMPFVDQYAVASTKLNTLNSTFPEMMKKSILQEAVQGKLVPQDPNDEPASVLLEKIAEEKKRLIKAGKIKKQKPLPEIMEEEIPFDIPESWEWVRLSDISKQITDGEHSTPKRVSDFCGFYLLSARNVRDGEIKLDDVDFVDSTEFGRISSRCNPVKGDILISCSGSVGRCAVVNDDNKYVMVRSAAMASPVMCDSNYLMYTIQSECVQRQIKSLKKQTAQANLFLGAISILKIPLPPYREQKRIVNRLNQILNHTEKAFKTLRVE